MKGLNRETLASYLGLLRASWPVDPADWDQFEAEAWRLVDRGPTFKGLPEQLQVERPLQLTLSIRP